MEHLQALSPSRHNDTNDGTSAVPDLENPARGKSRESLSSPSLSLLSRGSYRHYNKHRRRVSLKHVLTPAGGLILQAAGLFLVFALIHQYLKRYSVCVRRLSKSTPEASLATPGFSGKSWIVTRKLAASSNNGGSAPEQNTTGPLGEPPNQWCLFEAGTQVVYYSDLSKTVLTWDGDHAENNEYVYMSSVSDGEEYVDMGGGAGIDNYVDLHPFSEMQENASTLPVPRGIERVLVRPINEQSTREMRLSRGHNFLLTLYRAKYFLFATITVAALVFAGITWYRSHHHIATPAEINAATILSPTLLLLVLVAFVANAHYEYAEHKRARHIQHERQNV